MPKKSQKESKSTLKREQIRRWFSLPSYDLGRDYDDPITNSNVKHNKKTEEFENNTDASRQSSFLKHQKDAIAKENEKEEINDVIDLSRYSEDKKEGFAYIQMSLDSKLITENFHKSLQKRIADQVKIREATSKDIPKLVELYNRSFISANDPYTPMNEENMTKVFNYNNTVILIGSIWGTDAGFVIIDVDEIDENRKVGFIAGMGTLPEWRRRGVGSSLGILSYDFIFRKIPEIKELRCEVYSKNLPSFNLIKGMGFSVVGVKYYKF